MGRCVMRKSENLNLFEERHCDRMLVSSAKNSSKGCYTQYFCKVHTMSASTDPLLLIACSTYL